MERVSKSMWKEYLRVSKRVIIGLLTKLKEHQVKNSS